MSSFLEQSERLLRGEGSTAEPGMHPADLERMGPTFIKVGQLLSTRADLLPPPYLAALSRLQDRVEPFAFADVERIVTEELGVRLSKAFSEFHPIPMASASLAGSPRRAARRTGVAVRCSAQVSASRWSATWSLRQLAELAEKHRGRPPLPAFSPGRGVPPQPARARLPA
jgi:hypothetical protein